MQENKFYTENYFEGLCLDIGSQMSVGGLRQSKAYYKARGIPFSLNPSNLFFRFGSNTNKSLGIQIVRMPTPAYGRLQFHINIVSIDIPMLLGFPDLTSHNLLINYLDKKLDNKIQGWRSPITEKHGHLFWNPAIHTEFFTRPEIERLHFHFFIRQHQNYLIYFVILNILETLVTFVK